MIVLNYFTSGSTANNIVLELFSSAEGTTPIYLFDVSNSKGEIINTFIATDISGSPCRNQLFEITLEVLKKDETFIGLTSGILFLQPAQYEYKIYEVDSVSVTANKIKLLQTGLVVVKGDYESIYA